MPEKVIHVTIPNRLPEGKTILLSDATAELSTLQSLIGEETLLTDLTVQGLFPHHHQVTQFPLDVRKRDQSSNKLRCMIRGVMELHQDHTQFGIITHRVHLKELKELEEHYHNRIAKQTHFHSGEDRSSNIWHEVCDHLLILGTPRVPGEEIRKQLIRQGETEAASLQVGNWKADQPGDVYWKPYQWEGRTQTGKFQAVQCSGYSDDRWQGAYQDLVHAALLQSIGRARSILKTGIECTLITREPLKGHRNHLSEIPLPMVSADDAIILKELRTVDQDGIKLSELQTRLKANGFAKSDAAVRKRLKYLAECRMVKLTGKRWRVTPLVTFSEARNIKHPTQKRVNGPVL